MPPNMVASASSDGVIIIRSIISGKLQVEILYYNQCDLPSAHIDSDSESGGVMRE